MAPRTRSQTGSIPKKVVPFGDEVPTRGATTRLGRKAVTKPVKKKKTENAQERLLLEPHLPNPPAQLDLSKPLPRVGLSETALELPLAADAPTGQPRIFYGEDAPYPRWRTILDQRPLGEDLEKDLIRTHPGRTHIPGVAPGSHPRANDYTIGLGCVKWDFEPGPAAGWGGLTGHQLYEQACMRLRAALDDPWARWQLQDAIRKGENARYIAYVENPVPPLVRFGGRGALQVPPNDPLIVRIKENAYKIDHIVKNKPKWLDMQEFERPSLAWRPGEVEPDMGDYSRFVGLMKNHRFGTLGPPGYQDPSFDPTAKLNAKPVGIQPPTGGTGAAANAAGGSAVQQTEKAVGNLPTLSGQNPETSEAQSVAGDAKRLMQNAKRFVRNEQLQFVHKAQAQQRGRGKAAKKAPVRGVAPKENFAALAGAVQEDLPKLQLPSNEMDESSKYFRMCNEIVDDPEARQKYYPKVEAFRRIRSWAGAVMPAGVERDVKANISKVPRANRPFLNMKRTREASKNG